MQRRTLGYLIAIVAVVMVLVAVTGERGLPKATRAAVSAEEANLDDATAEFARSDADARSALESDPELFPPATVGASVSGRLDAARERLDEAETELRRATDLVERNQKDDAAAVDDALARVRALRAAAMTDVAEAGRVVDERLDFRRNLADHASRLRSERDALAATDLASIAGTVEKAASDWPAKRAELEARTSALSDARSRGLAAGDEVERLLAAGDQPDFDRLITTAAVLDEASGEVTALTEGLPGLVDQLYWSWERVLTDMEIREGAEVQFRHRIDLIRTHITDVASRANETAHETSWVPVSEKTYLAHEDHLGMTLERKAAGEFDHEAVSVVQPAGLGYVAPPEEKRNQYGYWNTTSGGSFWVWYGQYALMRDLFWGVGGYRPISTGHWRDYDTSRRAGRTFYGRDDSGRPTYGSKGRYTSSRYAGSRYVKSGGYASSRYKRSGGSYRGSRYASGSGGRGTSRGGRSGSRFGGGK